MSTAKEGLSIPPSSLAVPYCPECEMKFPPHKIMDTLTYDGKLYGFCSSACKASFAKRMGVDNQ
jgi:YHS domain-containing protein